MNLKAKIELFTLAVLLSIQLHSGFAASDTNAYPDVEELFERFRTEEIRCDFVIALDTSGSMKKDGLFGRVAQAISMFISILKPGDYLSIIAFDNYPRYLFMPQEIGEDTEKLKQAKLSWPSILQLPEPSGQKTDIGAALETTVAELNRPHANKLQFLFFITDGKHEPEANSKYPTLKHPNWDLLRQKAKRTLFDHEIAVTSLGLNQYTDIALIRKVFPQAVPLTVDDKGLLSFFERLKAELKYQKLRLQAFDELNRGKIEILPVSECKGRLEAGGTASFQFKLKSDYEHISTAVKIEEIMIVGDDYLECSFNQINSVFHLEPKGESPILTLNLTDHRRKRLFARRKVERKEVRVQFELAITFEPPKAFLKLNLNPKEKQVIKGAEER